MNKKQIKAVIKTLNDKCTIGRDVLKTAKISSDGYMYSTNGYYMFKHDICKNFRHAQPELLEPFKIPVESLEKWYKLASVKQEFDFMEAYNDKMDPIDFPDLELLIEKFNKEETISEPALLSNPFLSVVLQGLDDEITITNKESCIILSDGFNEAYLMKIKVK